MTAHPNDDLASPLALLGPCPPRNRPSWWLAKPRS